MIIFTLMFILLCLLFEILSTKSKTFYKIVLSFAKIAKLPKQKDYK